MSFAKCINNIETTLASPHTLGDTLVVDDAGGSTLGAGEWFRVTLERVSDGSYCIYRCDSISGNTLSSLTPIEGTSDISGESGDYVALRITAGHLQDIHEALLYTTGSPTTAVVGGIGAGTTFTAEPLSSVIDQMLHPYQAPGFTSFSISGVSTQEVGATISGSQTFLWSTSNSGNVLADSVSIADTTASVILGSSLSNSGSHPFTISVTKMAPATNTWTILAMNSLGGTFSTTDSIQWMWRMYSGTSTNITLDAAGIKGLANSLLTTTFLRTYTLAAGGYKYISFPDSFGSPSSFKDAGTLLSVAMCDSSDDSSYSHVANGISYALVSVTNTNSITTSYRVYRTKNILGSSIQIIVG